ncbi:MAG: DegV family protein [Chloroflexi bacterium]|nr:DegV family protein [Chloroflexota bacterium]
MDESGLTKRPVAVVTDSATALPERLALQAHLHIARMEITIGGKTYQDGPLGLSTEQFAQLKDRQAVPKTSAPKPAAWMEQFRAAHDEADSIFCVTLAARLSAAYDAARSASELALTELPGVTIRVFDSDTAAGAEGLVALAAAKKAAEGASLDAVESEAGRVAGEVRLLAYLDTLEYVWRSGRVPRVAVWATSLFDVKPVMEWYRGRVGSVARPRSRKKAAERILAEMERDIGRKRAHVIVMHADAPDDASELRRQIEARFDCAELHVTPFAAFMAAHTGPGLAGAAYWAE